MLRNHSSHFLAYHTETGKDRIRELIIELMEGHTDVVSKEVKAREARAAVTAGLNNQKTLKQLSALGEFAQANRPKAMARHAEHAANSEKREKVQGRKSDHGATGGGGGR
ncbi:hypothetical protein PRK78_006864 [Emydomyces testavorans]|uniref:Uncharacterized protein n=1 Tax=Emydomyces testavorans TaxID=2070801 RepID=A0AAF0DM88_9EURO|nr:hypothetical protein PRK78_006864 [Emydomyces testavorans]